MRKLASPKARRMPTTSTRPIGLGVQGLADAFIQMRMPFDSPEAKQLNKDLFETLARTARMSLASEFPISEVGGLLTESKPICRNCSFSTGPIPAKSP